MKKLLLLAVLSSLAIAAYAQDPPATPQTPAEPQIAVFSDYALGLEFDHPASWKRIDDPKVKKNLLDLDIFGKKKQPKNRLKQTSKETLFYIPAGDRTANLEIFSAVYNQSAEVWEEVQSLANKQLKREIDKQWREEILGVPLLLTKMTWEDAAFGKMVGLTGLVYSRTPQKLQFRLTAPADIYDSAEYELRQALQSIRTVRGGLPSAEDPSNPLDRSAYAAPLPQKPPKVLTIGATKPYGGKVKKGEVSMPLTVANRKVTLNAPAGWTFDASENGPITMRHGSVTGTVTVSVFSSLDSDPPQSAVLKASGMSLDEFTKVDRRQDMDQNPTLAGAELSSVWRFGEAASGALTTCDATGTTGDIYWVVRYRLQGKPSAAEKRAIEALLIGMSADLAP